MWQSLNILGTKIACTKECEFVQESIILKVKVKTGLKHRWEGVGGIHLAQKDDDLRAHVNTQRRSGSKTMWGIFLTETLSSSQGLCCL
jgi:hypothetical protein